MRITIEEAEELADSMDLAGTDSSQLRAAISEMQRGYGQDVIENLVEQKKKEAERSTGTCTICNTERQILYAGACDKCFKEWVVSSYEERLKKTKGRL